MTDKNQTIILVRESWVESAKRDAATVLAAFAMIGPGWLMDSTMLALTGWLIFVLLIFTRASGLREKYSRTPEEALAEIQAIIAARDKK